MAKLSGRITNLERGRLTPIFLFINRPVPGLNKTFKGFRVKWPTGETQDYVGECREIAKAKINHEARIKYPRGIHVIQYSEINDDKQ